MLQKMATHCEYYETSGQLFKNLCLPYPQCNLAPEWQHWRQHIRLQAASSGANSFSHMCNTPQNTLKCRKLVELPFTAYSRLVTNSSFTQLQPLFTQLGGCTRSAWRHRIIPCTPGPFMPASLQCRAPRPLHTSPLNRSGVRSEIKEDTWGFISLLLLRVRLDFITRT